MFAHSHTSILGKSLPLRKSQAKNANRTVGFRKWEHWTSFHPKVSAHKISTSFWVGFKTFRPRLHSCFFTSGISLLYICFLKTSCQTKSQMLFKRAFFLVKSGYNAFFHVNLKHRGERKREKNCQRLFKREFYKKRTTFEFVWHHACKKKKKSVTTKKSSRE